MLSQDIHITSFVKWAFRHVQNKQSKSTICKEKAKQQKLNKTQKTTIQPHRITQNKQTNREHSPVTQNQMRQIDESASVQTSYSGVASRLWEGLGGKVL